MSFFRTAWLHPRKLFLRRALFQIHLWLGLLLVFYVVIIGVSGSILVFEDDLDRLAVTPHGASLPSSTQQASLALVLMQARNAHRDAHVTYITTPTEEIPFFEIFLRPDSGKRTVFAADPRSGMPLPVLHRWLYSVAEVSHDIHIYLLMGSTGLLVNGALSGVLLVVVLTGVVLWWPGVRSWARGLRLSLARHGGRGLNWRRVNFDLHHAVGIWTLAWSFVWAGSSVYFAFPTPFENLLDKVSPVSTLHAPSPRQDLGKTMNPSLDTILDAAKSASTGHFLAGLSVPESPSGNYVVALDRQAAGDFTHRDFVAVSGRTGTVLQILRNGDNHSVSDEVISLLSPLHFGNLWGLFWKIVWAALGLSLPVLGITGVVMYWNRFLRQRWHRLIS